MQNGVVFGPFMPSGESGLLSQLFLELENGASRMNIQSHFPLRITAPNWGRPMKNAVGGIAFATFLTLMLGSVLTGNDGYVRGQPNTPRQVAVSAPHGGAMPAASGTGLMAFSKPLGDGQEQLILVDPQTRVLSVYHIEPATGKTALKSVRKLEWDLQLNAFNTQDPQPLDVRTMVAPR